MAREPHFIDVWGNTIRIDLPITPAHNIKLTLVTTTEHDQQGHTVKDCEVMEFYLNSNHAKQLADIFYAEEVNKLISGK